MLLLAAGLLVGLYLTRNIWLPSTPPTSLPGPTATRVTELGSGDVQITLTWNSTNDLDLWVTDPSGKDIYYLNPSSVSGGLLDVDANAGCQGVTTQPVENIYWPAGVAPHGRYVVRVQYFKQCEVSAPIAYTVRILVDGQTTDVQDTIRSEGDWQDVKVFSR